MSILSRYEKILKDCVEAVKRVYGISELRDEHIRTVNTLFIQICRAEDYIMNDEEPATATATDEPATEKQLKLLSHFGVINIPKELTKKEASLLIEIIRKNKRSLIINLQKDLEGGNGYV